MRDLINLDYFYGIEAEQFAFYRIPKLLIKDKRFSGISSDAKMLYGLMLDRMQLSVKNGWLDDSDRVYIIYTVDQIMEDFSCCKEKAIKMLSELNGSKGIGLIEKVRRGQGKPDIIYVKNFVIQDEETDSFSEVGKSKFQKSEKQTSRSLENKPLEVGKTDPNNNNINNTDMNNTEDITTTESVVAARELFKAYGLNEKDIKAILSVADNDIQKCKVALERLKAQKSHVGNIVGWLIKAIKENYQLKGYDGTDSYSVSVASNKDRLSELEEYYLSW